MRALERSRADRVRRLSLACLVLLLAWYLGWRVFGVSELGQDGFLSVDLGFAPLPEMLAFTVHDVHPPLYYAILHGWFALVGINYVPVKFVTVASGVLALAVTERLGARLVGRWPALLAMVLLALSPTYLRLTATARDFIPGLLLTLLTLWLTLSLLAAKRPRRQTRLGQTALALATAAALLTSYFQLGIVAAEIAVVVITARQSARAALNKGSERSDDVAATKVAVRSTAPAATALALGFGAVLAAPWYWYFVPQLLSKLRTGTTGYVSAPKPPSLAAALNAVTEAVTGAVASPATSFATVAWGLVLLLGAIVVAGRPSGPGTASLRRAALFAGLALSALEVALVLWRWQQSSSLGTYILALLPFTALLQAAAISQGLLAIRALAAVAMAGSVAVQFAWFLALARGTPIDFTRDQPLQNLASVVRPGEGLIFSDHARRGQYLLISNWEAAKAPAASPQHTLFPDGGCGHGVACAVIMTSDVSESYLHTTAAAAAAIARRVAAQTSRIWYAESGEPAGTTSVGLLALNGVAYPASRQPMAATIIWQFYTAPPDRQLRPNLTLGRSVTLATAAFTSRAAPSGAVAVQLVWHDVQPLPADYTVFVHLDAPDGHLAAQQDGPPVTGLRLTSSWRAGDVIDDRHAIALPPALPVGNYRLDVGLYRGDQRLALPDGTNTIQLGTVRVVAR